MKSTDTKNQLCTAACTIKKTYSIRLTCTQYLTYKLEHTHTHTQLLIHRTVMLGTKLIVEVMLFEEVGDLRLVLKEDIDCLWHCRAVNSRCGDQNERNR